MQIYKILWSEHQYDTEFGLVECWMSALFTLSGQKHSRKINVVMETALQSVETRVDECRAG